MEKKAPEILKPWIRRAVARKRQIKKIPHVFDYKSMLYIGANPSRIEMVDLFYMKGYVIDVLEVHEPNWRKLKTWNAKHHIFRDIYLGDACFIDKHFKNIAIKWDVIMFWHGPEHVAKEFLSSTLDRIERFASHIVILGCPRGRYIQGEIDNNPFEIHASYLYEKDFHALGYETNTLRPKKTRGSNITAWKVIK